MLDFLPRLLMILPFFALGADLEVVSISIAAERTLSV